MPKPLPGFTSQLLSTQPKGTISFFPETERLSGAPLQRVASILESLGLKDSDFVPVDRLTQLLLFLGETPSDAAASAKKMTSARPLPCSEFGDVLYRLAVSDHPADIDKLLNLETMASQAQAGDSGDEKKDVETSEWLSDDDEDVPFTDQDKQLCNLTNETVVLWPGAVQGNAVLLNNLKSCRIFVLDQSSRVCLFVFCFRLNFFFFFRLVSQLTYPSRYP